MADPLASASAHSNSFISFCAAQRRLLLADGQTSLAARAAKGNLPSKEEFVGSSLRARSQSSFTNSTALNNFNANTNKPFASSFHFWLLFAPQYSFPWPSLGTYFGFFVLWGANSIDKDIKLRAAIVCSDIGQPEPEPEPSGGNVASHGS